jgi:hypothetical protein
LLDTLRECPIITEFPIFLNRQIGLPEDPAGPGPVRRGTGDRGTKKMPHRHRSSMNMRDGHRIW